MRLMLIACLALFAAITPARAGGGPGIFAQSGEILGARFGLGEAETLAILRKSLFEPDEDTGRIVGCPLDGVDVRWVSWGGLTIEFEEGEDGVLRFARWSYRLDAKTGRPIAGGPHGGQIILPGKFRAGDRFSDAVRAWGFEPKVDEVFEVAIHYDETTAHSFTIMTTEADIDAPITLVGAPYIALCE